MPHAPLVTAEELPLYGLSQDFLHQFEPAELDAQLQAVTDEALGRMSPAVKAPLTAWGADIKAAVGRIAAYELKSLRGLSPTGVSFGDENLLVRAQQARQWLDAVGAGNIDPQDLIDASGDTTSGGEFVLEVLSDPVRSW